MVSNPFDYAHAAGHNKKYIMETDEDEKNYSPFLINRFFSYFADTILFSEEMNLSPILDKKLQFDYYYYALRPRKRFSKWAKKMPDSNIDIVMKYYQLNRSKAKSAVKALTKDQIAELKTRLGEGGQNT